MANSETLPQCRLLSPLIGLALALGLLCANGQRVAPPPTEISVPNEVRTTLELGLAELAGEIARAETAIKDSAEHRDLLPDVLIFQKAVGWALNHDEFFKEDEFSAAERLLSEGVHRARSLASLEAPWTRQTGLVVRGYRSRIDDSVQPYGLVIPESWSPRGHGSTRLDVWLHGRDNYLTDLRFVDQRMRSRGEFAPADAIVLHPYGRFCNAFKFAGETDVFEALEHVKKYYRIDEDRVAMRGFSMGGAGCWHLAAHHPDRWFVATPGAGFAESAEYLDVWSKDPKPEWYEQKLWGLYDATDYAQSFFNLPVIAYNGDQDKQMQAADVMERAMGRRGIRLARVTGLRVGHKYTPAAKTTLANAVDSLAGRPDKGVPREVRFTTRTLRYPQSHWIRIEGLKKHWEEAIVQAEIQSGGINVMTANITALSLNFGPGDWPQSPGGNLIVQLDGQAVSVPGALSDLSLKVEFHQTHDGWVMGQSGADQLRKRPGLQGPIDDAWFDSFMIVTPSALPMNDVVGDWIEREQSRAITEWRNQFRGDPRVKRDVDVKDDDITNHHLILFGDPHSNLILQRILSSLPLVWNTGSLRLAGRQTSSTIHAPVMIYPNPLNPLRYIVINSGFTWRNFPSNADQTPKLPDFALIDVTKPATSKTPGGVVHAGFFDERWRVSSD